MPDETVTKRPAEVAAPSSKTITAKPMSCVEAIAALHTTGRNRSRNQLHFVQVQRPGNPRDNVGDLHRRSLQRKASGPSTWSSFIAPLAKAELIRSQALFLRPALGVGPARTGRA